MKLVDILPVENIKIPLAGASKDEILIELVDLIAGSNPHIDSTAVLKAIRDREATMSTGIGHGIAIPHAKTRAVKEITAALGIVPGGIDFDALDGEPVTLFFLLVAPEGPAAPHLRCLSMISRLLNSEEFRRTLAGSTSAEEALHLIAEGEEALTT